MPTKTKYKPEYAAQAYKLTRSMGATNVQLAEFFDVSLDTIRGWKKKYAAFSDAIYDGKEIANNRVKRALYERAIGYDAIDTKFATFEGQITDSKEYTKHFPPSEVACIFWLKNRDPEHWCDKPLPNSDDEPEAMTITFEVKPPASDIEVTNAGT